MTRALTVHIVFQELVASLEVRLKLTAADLEERASDLQAAESRVARREAQVGPKSLSFAINVPHKNAGTSDLQLRLPLFCCSLRILLHISAFMSSKFMPKYTLQIAVEQERVVSLKAKMERMAEELHGQEDALDGRQTNLQAAQSQLWTKVSVIFEPIILTGVFTMSWLNGWCTCFSCIIISEKQ